MSAASAARSWQSTFRATAATRLQGTCNWDLNACPGSQKRAGSGPGRKELRQQEFAACSFLGSMNANSNLYLESRLAHLFVLDTSFEDTLFCAICTCLIQALCNNINFHKNERTPFCPSLELEGCGRHRLQLLPSLRRCLHRCRGIGFMFTRSRRKLGMQKS